MPGIYDYLPFIKHIIRTRKSLVCNFVDWDEKESVFIPVSWKTPKVFVFVVFDICYYLVVLQRLYKVIADEEDNGGGAIQNIPSLLCFWGGLFGLLMNLILLKKSELFAVLMNSILVLEKRTTIEDKESVPKTKNKISAWKESKALLLSMTQEVRKALRENNMGKILLIAGVNTDVVICLMPIALLLLSPCKLPVFLRSTLSDCNVRGGFAGFQSTTVSQTILFVIDWLGFTHGYLGGCFGAAVSWPVPVFVIGDHTTRLVKAVAVLPPDKSAWKNFVDDYRSVKLLEILYNDMNMSEITVLLLIDMFGCAIMGTFSCIALHDQLSLPVLIFMAVNGFDCTVLAQLVDFQAAGNVHHYSQKIQHYWGATEFVRKDKFLSRSTTALSVFKIRVGKSGNFLENGTPLINIQFTMDQVVSLLLATK